MYRIGCDVGGTNTDAAILDITKKNDPSRGVLATCKTPTTADVTSGIKHAIEEVVEKAGIDHDKILNVAIGTTHFVNAVVENDARHLSRVACVRLCGPHTRETPPFVDYPWSLRDRLEGPVYYLDGGLEIDGREIAPLDVDQVRQTAFSIYEAGITAVAIVGIFSALDHQGLHEQRCRQIMLETCPTLDIVCSCTIGGPGLLVRENATILNAAILSFAKRTIAGFQRAILELGLQCPLFLTQNDGTLIEASLAAELPVKTFASGPTNSLMGAAFLQDWSSLSDVADKQVLVVDVGGTTTDVCALLPSGFPRKAPNLVEVGGVRTAFSMPDVYSVGLGGGSRIRVSDGFAVTIGPDSVAHHLTTESLVFGGSTMTTTDIVVAGGGTSIGDKNMVTTIPSQVVSAARREINTTLIKAIDRMKVSNAPTVVLLVGGGSIIVEDKLPGILKILRPPHHDSANAVGAAIAKVSGDVDTIEILEGKDERQVLDRVKQRAVDAAIKNGADEDQTRVVDVTKLPLQYVNNKATRFIIKAAGPIGNRIPETISSRTLEDTTLTVKDPVNSPEIQKGTSYIYRTGSLATPALDMNLTSYRPLVRNSVWTISPIDVELISVGCGILGTGGGGSPYSESLYVLSILHQGNEHPIQVIPPESLADDDITVSGAGFGAPSVASERVESGIHIYAAIDVVNKILGIDDFHGVVAGEIGGGNGLITFPTAAHYGRPVVDCDFMGRAFPTIEHCTPYLYGQPITPASATDTKGNVVVVLAAENYAKVEGMLRTTCVELGNHIGVACRPLSGEVVKKYAVPNTVSQCWFLGRAVRMAQRLKTDFIQALQEVMPVKLIYEGKIIDVERDVSKGYTVGKCTIAPFSEDEAGSGISAVHDRSAEGRTLVIPFQNEYLAAYLIDNRTSHNTGEIKQEDFLCTVPDLISILGQDGEAIGSPELRYGLQVKVIAMPAHPHWTTKEGLRVGGPSFFHLDTPWVSIGEYQKPKSVFEVFGDGG